MANPGNLDWNDLRYFLAAVRAGTLAGAARGLGVKHSTVGRRLSALERALGGALFVRGPEGLRLTPLGEKLVPLAEGMERAASGIQAEASKQTAHVRLALLTGFLGLFSRHAGLFERDHPGISLEFVNSDRLVDLRNNEADLALLHRPPNDDSLIIRKVADAGWSLYGSEAYLSRRTPPEDPRQLAGHDLVGFGENLREIAGAKWIAEHGEGARIAIHVQEATDFVGAAAAGVGLAVIPCVLASTDPRLKRLTPEVLCRIPLWLIYRREARLAKPIQAVARFVVDVMRREMETIGG